jgi:glutamate-5-semialdehyde dehydrogenase
MKYNLTSVLIDVRAAARKLSLLDGQAINEVLLTLAEEVVKNTDLILVENAKDLAKMDKSNPMYDRLLLSKERMAAIAADIRNVASLPSPLGKVLMEATRPNGMRIAKVTVPFGVIGVIYEARPNVTFDVFSLCFKTANACVLKGGTDAAHSNAAIVSVIHGALAKHNISSEVAILLPYPREYTTELLNAEGLVDLIIPRGSASLISFVRHSSCIPVIETGTGVCHVYVDDFADIQKARHIITNAKTRRVSVCNAAECLVVHKKRLCDLPEICADLAAKNVILYADKESYGALKSHYPEKLLQVAKEEHFGCEFQDYKMAVKTASDVEDAIDFINAHGTMHSECIVSESPENMLLFQKMVDAACVYANVSTAFSDGAQFGMGAEIGISTQKLHARGPMALPELCSYKWLINGEGQTRT